MAHKTRKNVVASGVGSLPALFYIYDFVATWLAANGFSGRLEVAASGAAGGDFLSESGPHDDAYVVIQPADDYAWGDATRWQLLVAARNTASASTVSGAVAGEAIPNAGLWFGFCRDGGWNDTDKNFGANPLFTGLRNVKGYGHSGPATTGVTKMHLACWERETSGVVDGVVFLMVGDDANDGTWDFSCIMGHGRRYNAANVKPTQFLVGFPQNYNGNTYWGEATGEQGAREKDDDSGVNAVFTDGANHGSGQHLVSGTGEWIGTPIELFDATVAGAVGYLEGVYAGDTSVGSGSEDDSHAWVMINGILFPV